MNQTTAIRKVNFKVLSDVKCSELKCNTRLKQNFVDKKRRADGSLPVGLTCYKCHCGNNAKNPRARKVARAEKNTRLHCTLDKVGHLIT